MNPNGPMTQTQNFIRFAIYALCLLLGLAIITIALFFNQVQGGTKYIESVKNQSIRSIRIPSKRGKIISSDLQILASNQPNFELVFYLEEMRQPGFLNRTRKHIYKQVIEVSKVLNRPIPLTFENIKRHINLRPGLPMVVFENLSFKDAAMAMEWANHKRGIDIQVSEKRYYPFGNLAAHILGYTRMDSPLGAHDRKSYSYYLPDVVGKEGVEKAFDNLKNSNLGLCGTPGYSLVQVDHLGFINRNLIDKIEPVNGLNLVLTIDSRAQKLAEDVLINNRGAIVLIEANSGDVLAAASNPRYSLEEFNKPISGKRYREILNKNGSPMLNRAFQGTYTPGSILKPLIGLAFLENGVNPEEVLDCDGGTDINEAHIRCASYRSGGHGELNIIGAMEKSCNDYMIEHGIKLGANKMREILWAAGIGQKTGIELAEARGNYPTEELKRRLYRQKWTNYDTALLSMGQGIITVTPLQAALFCGALANGGKIMKPHIGLKLTDQEGNARFERKVEVRNTLPVSKKNLDIIVQGMYEVVNSPTGSGRRAKVDGLTIYGKTGSAEIGSRKNRKINAWFIAFTKYLDKTYALALIIEDATSGGLDCAPLAGGLLRDYILGHVAKDNPKKTEAKEEPVHFI